MPKTIRDRAEKPERGELQHWFVSVYYPGLESPYNEARTVVGFDEVIRFLQRHKAHGIEPEGITVDKR